MKKLTNLLLLVVLISLSKVNSTKSGEKPSWAKKDIRDYTDADMERLLDQWEVSFFGSDMYLGKIINSLDKTFIYRRATSP